MSPARRLPAIFAADVAVDGSKLWWPLLADFVAEFGIQTARDGWCIFWSHPLSPAGLCGRLTLDFT